MIPSIGPVFRPPSEAHSFILQVTLGCSHNKCSYCQMYASKPFRIRTWTDIKSDIDSIAQADPTIRRIFLADGDALVLSTERLLQILKHLNNSFPKLERVGIYVYAPNLKNKNIADLKQLVQHKLRIGYMGLESGSDTVLQLVKKGCTASDMTSAVHKMHEAGMKSSLICLLGIGGIKHSQNHITKTAEVISNMNPTFFSTLTTTLVPGTELYDMQKQGAFTLPDVMHLLYEQREILARVTLKKCIFRSNHASNYLPLQGVLNRDRNTLLKTLDASLKGQHKLRPEWARGL